MPELFSKIRSQITSRLLLIRRTWSELRALLPFTTTFALKTKVRISTAEQAELESIEQLRQSLLSDNQTIEVEDFGAGSKNPALKAIRTEQIKDVCRIASKPMGSCMLLYRLIRQNNPENVLELGTCLGISTAYLAMALRHQSHGKMTSMEGSAARAKIAEENLQNLGLENYATIIPGRFSDLLGNYLEGVEFLDFAFIDGHHQGDATLDYFNQMIPKFMNGGIMVFDDIYWSSDMYKAWRTIKKSGLISDSFAVKGMGIIKISIKN